MKNILAYITIIFAVLSCAKVDDGKDNTSSTVAIAAPMSGTTRTSIDASDSATVNWSKTDKIYLWAKADGKSSYDIENVEFRLNYFSPSYDEAIFTADVNSQSLDANYTYYAAYPKPKSVSGSAVTFTLPTEQNGSYDGSCDLMLATAEGAALDFQPSNNVKLSFKHLTHVIRIEIPQDRDLLKNTSKLVVSFPQSVVGDLQYNITASTPTASFPNLSFKTITITSSKPFTESKYIWLFVKPAEIDGTITFTGYTKEGFQSENITVKLYKKLEAGRITPITLTVPEEIPGRTTITLKEVGNNLGEKIQKVTFTAPAGAKFVGEKTAVTLPYNASNTYSVHYYSSQYGDKFAGKAITVKYESEHAIVSGDDINITAEHHDKVSTFNQTIPYLFEEDFSGITESDENGNSAVQSDDVDIPGCAGWIIGPRGQWWTKKSIAIRSYAVAWTTLDSWVYSPEMSKIKAGKSATVKVLFKADWKKNREPDMVLDINGKTIKLDNNSNASKDNIPTDREVEISGIKSNSRIKWTSKGQEGNWEVGNDPVYIDDVRVQIVP